MKWSTFFRIAVIFLVLIFVAHHFISSVYNPIKTENAVYYTATDGITINGLIIRNEVLVTSDNNGVLHFLVDDGGKVPKDGVIANIYESEAASITLTKIDSVKSKIYDIEDILGYNDVDAVNLDVISTKVENKVNELILSSATSDFSNVNNAADNLLSAINRKQAALGYDVDFNSKLESLNNQLTELSSALPSPVGTITALESGYFVSKTDGYENVFKTDNLESITYDFLNSAKSEKYSSNVIGKLVSDYEWYIAAEISVDKSLEFKEGESLTIETSVKTSLELPVTVKKINVSNKDDKAIIIFSCNQMSSDLATMRSGPMTVVKARYSGLKIPKKAYRVIDSKKGVFIQNGMQINFVPVEKIYTGDNYFICEKQNENELALKLYDKVVVKGKNLYDGKIIS